MSRPLARAGDGALAGRDTTLRVHWHRGRLATMAGLLGLIAAGGLLLLGQDDQGARLLGLAWTAVLGAGAVRLLACRLDRRPVIVIDGAGLLDRRIAAEPLPWAALSGLEAYEAEHVHFLGLELHAPGKALARARPLVRLLAPVHRLFGYPSLSISLSLLDGSEAEVLAAILARRPDLA